jgi:UDP-N-acetylmuramate dehydrogenase
MTSLADLIAEGLVEEGVPLGPLTTYKAGGPARFLARVTTRADLVRLIESGVTRTFPILVLGRGSNLVVADRGFNGVVIQLGGEFATIEFADLEVVAGAAVPLPRLARAAADRGITGLEFFVGVPGSVGGAVRQNAGCFGSETRDCLVHAEVVDLLDGGMSYLTSGELELGYRHSNLKPEQLVTRARFVGAHGDLATSSERMRAITRWRRDNQPGGTLNAGSVFKNPEGTTAGELIDQLGLKGTARGGVAVSERHANFFVAGPGARAEDIRDLVNLVKDRVFEATGTILEPEIQFVGFEE